MRLRVFWLHRGLSNNTRAPAQSWILPLGSRRTHRARPRGSLGPLRWDLLRPLRWDLLRSGRSVHLSKPSSFLEEMGPLQPLLGKGREDELLRSALREGKPVGQGRQSALGRGRGGGRCLRVPQSGSWPDAPAASQSTRGAETGSETASQESARHRACCWKQTCLVIQKLFPSTRPVGAAN